MICMPTPNSMLLSDALERAYNDATILRSSSRVPSAGCMLRAAGHALGATGRTLGRAARATGRFIGNVINAQAEARARSQRYTRTPW